MTKPIARDSIYRRRSFDADIIELCVRWYVAILQVTGRYAYCDVRIRSGNTWRCGVASTSTISLSKITARSSAAVRR